jgi:hypothetical protein
MKKSYSTWSDKEISYISEYIDKEIDWHDLIFYLSDRSKESIRNRVYIYRHNNINWSDQERTLINQFIYGRISQDHLFKELMHTHTTARIKAQIDAQKVDLGMKSPPPPPDGYNLLKLLAMRPDKRESFLIKNNI